MHSSQSIIFRVLLLLQAVCTKTFSFDRHSWKDDGTVINLSGQGITRIDGSSIARLDEKQRQRVKVLYLNYNKLTSLPEEIGLLENLQQLCLRENQLTSLPEGIGKLKSLKHLHLSDNKLTKFPSVLLGLESLKYLWLYGNQLTSLPDMIGRLKSLKHLWLNGNRLTTLPAGIENLKSLEKLWLAGNSISQTGNAEGKTVGRNELGAMFGSRVVF